MFLVTYFQFTAVHSAGMTLLLIATQPVAEVNGGKKCFVIGHNLGAFTNIDIRVKHAGLKLFRSTEDESRSTPEVFLCEKFISIFLKEEDYCCNFKMSNDIR
ncbi:L-gulonolactone oxidase, partial [Biomphalaria glabrata]